MAKDNDQVSDDLRAFLSDVVPETVELVAIRAVGKPPSRKVTVIIGCVGGLTLDQVADTTRAINQALDGVEDTDQDPVPGGYTLEVTTPGVNWPLTNRADFVRVGTHPVSIQTHDGDTIVGPVDQASDDAVTVQTQSGPVMVPYTTIAKAVQALPF